jgi:hypothetical protein
VRSNQGGRPDILSQSPTHAAFAGPIRSAFFAERMGWRRGVPTDVVEHETKGRDLQSCGLFCVVLCRARFVLDRAATRLE